MSSPLLDSRRLLKYLAVGRFGYTESRDRDRDRDRDKPARQVIENKIAIIAHNIDKDDKEGKSIKLHLRAILKRGWAKLSNAPGKRIRLRSVFAPNKKPTKDEDENAEPDESSTSVDVEELKYDVHIIANRLEDEEDEHDKETKTTKFIVHFAVTSTTFPRYYDISMVLGDLVSCVRSRCSNSELWSCSSSSSSSVSSSLSVEFVLLTSKYGASPLVEASVKVSEVRTLMQDSVKRALSTVEQLEDMEEASSNMEESTRVFEKHGRAMKSTHRSSYYKLTACIFIVVVALMCYFIIPAAIKAAQHSSSSPTPIPTPAPNTTNTTKTNTTKR